MSRRAFLRRASRDERGLVLPTRLMVFGISVVALAGLAFVATQSGDDTADTVNPAAVSHPKPTPTATGGTTTIPVTPTTSARPKPAVRRGKVYVEVYNNSNVKGLAGKTGTLAQRAGWNVVGTDNWYGTVDTSTVYYAPRLKAAAALLAKDLGITKVKPAVAPMRFDRLTVILTGDYADRS
jgi:tartrate dehydratase beta subunit/fumarate hydratase class I family protein